MLVGAPRVLLLQPPGVGQHQLAEIGGSRGAEDAAAEAVRNQPRQQPAVVEMGVRQHHRLHRRRLDRQPRPVPLAQRLQPLEHAAVDEDTMLIDLEQVLGPGNRAGRAEKRQRGH
jgi:hypothetical protein